MSSVYTNTYSAETQIRQALIYQLGLIATGSGYLNDVAAVLRDFPDDPDSLTDFPTISVLTAYEHRTHFDNETLYVAMKVPLIVFVDPGGTVGDEIESIKQDIHYVIGNHPELPGSGGGATSQLAIFAAAEPFGTVLDNPLAGSSKGVKIVLDVTYQQLLTDPTVN